MNSIESTIHDLTARDRELPSCWEALITVLGKEIDVYGELLDICGGEREILVKRFSAQDLLESNARKETIILKAKMIDESRMKVVARIGELLGISPDAIDLTTLIAHADKEKGAKLKELQGRLRSLLEKLNENNDENKELLDSSILYVQKSIEFISSLVSSPKGYGMDGELKVTGSPGRIVCRKE